MSGAPEVEQVHTGRIPDATVSRLPTYLNVLLEAVEEGTVTLSSEELARAAGMNSAKVRKDLSYLGTHGTRGVGYDVEGLSREISRSLGLTEDRPVVLVGAGNLGRALASYDGFTRRGFRIVALVDADPGLVGQEVAGLPVHHLDDLEEVIGRHPGTMAVLAIPAAHAQVLADRLVAAGVCALLSFAPTHLAVPAGVTVRRVDLSNELQVLSYHEQVARAELSAVGPTTATPPAAPVEIDGHADRS